MKNALGAVLVACGLGALSAQAADFWEKKPWTQWDAQEIQKILNDSPWARPVDVYLPGGGVPARLDDAMGGAGPQNPEMRDGSGMPGGGEPNMPGPGMGGGMATQTGTNGPPVRLVVRFMTALPVKQALARARYGAEAGNSPEVQRTLNAAEGSYVVAISGLEQAPVNAPALTKMASLRLKGKDPFPAERAQADKGSVLLFFPRKDRPIALEDREVEVQLRLPGASIRRTFKLKDMVYNGKLEI